jgi:cytochrome c-type biogenesis protein CcmF
MGIGPLTRWKQDEPRAVLRRVVGPALFALVGAVAIGWAAGRVSLLTTGGLLMSGWIVATLFVDLKQRLLPPGGRIGQVIERARLLPLAMVGMFVAHVGIAAFAFGVTMVKTYETERDVKMGPNDATEIAGYSFAMTQPVREIQGPNYVASQATIEVTRDGRAIATLHPEKRIYRVQTNPMTEADVDSNPLRDLYVSMGEQLPGGEWVVRVQYKPFIIWTWGGCLLMMAGGILAASDRRYRSRKTAASLAPSSSAEAAA